MSTVAKQCMGECRYVFRLPIRVIHWTIFFGVAVLSVTGYWIGSGNLPAGPGGVFQMGWVRYVHTLTGWILLAALLLRIYLFFRGGEYARWNDFVPRGREAWSDLKDVLLFYLFARRDYPHAGFGHNRLAGITYLVVYLLLLFMVVSGLAIHGMAFPIGWQSWLSWPLAFVTAPTLRLMHHMGMWLLWGFAVHHVSSAILVDRETEGGLMSGIFSGYKFLPQREK